MGMLKPFVLSEWPWWVLCPVSALPRLLLEKLVPGRSPCSEQPSLLIKRINPDVSDAFVIVLEQSPGADHRLGVWAVPVFSLCCVCACSHLQEMKSGHWGDAWGDCCVLDKHTTASAALNPHSKP